MSASENGFYAVLGSGHLGNESVWHSTDGDTWSQIAEPGTFDDHYISAVIASGDTVLVWGQTGDKFSGECRSGRTWSTNDGQHWSAGPADQGFLVRCSGSPALFALPQGFGLHEFTSDGPRLLTTTDGASWDAEPVTGLPLGLSDFKVGRGGFLATGSWYDGAVVRNGIEGANVPMLSISRDGSTWFGTDEMRTVLEPADGNLWLYDGALSDDTILLSATSWGDLSRDCEGGECPSVLIVGPVPEP